MSHECQTRTSCTQEVTVIQKQVGTGKGIHLGNESSIQLHYVRSAERNLTSLSVRLFTETTAYDRHSKIGASLSSTRYLATNGRVNIHCARKTDE